MIMPHAERPTDKSSADRRASGQRGILDFVPRLDGPENVGNSERVISGVLGGLLLSHLSTRSFLNGLAFLTGCGLVYRALTGHCPLYEQMGCSTVAQVTGRGGSEVHLDTVDLPELSDSSAKTRYRPKM